MAGKGLYKEDADFKEKTLAVHIHLEAVTLLVDLGEIHTGESTHDYQIR